MITEKTKVTEIHEGDVVDFDAHTGLLLIWDDEPVSSPTRPRGIGLVTSVERSTTTDNHRKQSYVKIGFAERALTLFVGSKLPVRRAS
jgi:hypothetical protein